MNIKELKVDDIVFTDYPIIEFGDIPEEEAPIRKCIVIENNFDKYVMVDVYHLKTDTPCRYMIKSGYLYKDKNKYKKRINT